MAVDVAEYNNNPSLDDNDLYYSLQSLFESAYISLI